MKKLLFLILLAAHCLAAYTQPIALEWQACFGTPYKEIVFDVCATGDGYLIAAEGNTNSPRGIDVLLIRTDLTGNIIWEKYLGGSSSDTPTRIFPAGNDTYYISAISGSIDGDISNNPYPDGLSNNWIVMINGQGEIIWDKMYGGNCFERDWDACLTHDGGMASLGYTCSDDGDISNYYGMWDTWLLRTDSLGNKLWDFSIGTAGLDFPSAVIQTSDRGFLVASGSMPTTGGNISCQPYDLETSDIVLFKIDSMANIEWQQCIGGSSEEAVQDMIEVEDGYMLACIVDAADGDMTGSGYHYGYDSQGHPYTDVWLAKLDFEGNIVWHKCYGGTAPDVPNSIFSTGDGGYIVIAETESNNGDVSGKHQPHGYFSDIWVFKINASGDLLWQKCIGGMGYDRLDWSGVLDMGDGSYVIASTMQVAENAGDINCAVNIGSFDIWLIQIRDTTVVGSNEQPAIAQSLLLYPNPSTTQSWLQLPGNTSLAQAQIALYSPAGKLLHKAKPSSHFHKIDVAHLPKGLYLVRLWDGERWYMEKLLVR
ncbi:MAG: T9SS type A sorting domain-containing protein [Bacteroidales bacterium]|jgi:hypothetical protein|nr:T9SS type A sorting domain-containing protein [Bacteroidales bacterium]